MVRWIVTETMTHELEVEADSKDEAIEAYHNSSSYEGDDYDSISAKRIKKKKGKEGVK
jgi:hypothetical protein